MLVITWFCQNKTFLQRCRENQKTLSREPAMLYLTMQFSSMSQVR